MSAENLVSGGPNVFSSNNTAVLTGGGSGATVGESITDAAGMHGFYDVQQTGWGTPTGGNLTIATNYAGVLSNANSAVTSTTLATLLTELIAKGIIGS